MDLAEVHQRLNPLDINAHRRPITLIDSGTYALSDPLQTVQIRRRFNEEESSDSLPVLRP